MKKSTDAAFASLRYKCRELQRKFGAQVKQDRRIIEMLRDRLQVERGQVNAERAAADVLLGRVTALENELHECRTKPCASVCGDAPADVQDHAELRYLEAQLARARTELANTKESLQFKSNWLDSVTAENRRLDDELAKWQLIGTVGCCASGALLSWLVYSLYPSLIALVQ